MARELQERRRVVDAALRSLLHIHAPEVKARGLIVRSEIDRVLGTSQQVESHLRPITDGELTPIDPAEGGWAWNRDSEARLDLGDITGALEAVSRYRNYPRPIENKLDADRANAVEHEANSSLTKKGLWLRDDEPVQKLAVYEKRLQQWLLNRTQHLPNLQRSELLGISPNTISKWKSRPD